LVDFTKWRPTVCRKTNEDVCLEATPQKGLHDVCGSKFVGKSRTTTFRASLGKFGKNPSQLPKFACSHTYAIVTYKNTFYHASAVFNAFLISCSFFFIIFSQLLFIKTACISPMPRHALGFKPFERQFLIDFQFATDKEHAGRDDQQSLQNPEERQ